jgi:hypothetical protein
MVSRKVPWGKDVPGSEVGRADLEAGRPAENAESPPTQRTQSAVTNGTRFLPGVDGRNPWARRCRDISRAFIVDLGGKDNASAAQLALARRASVLVVQLEQLEARMAEGDNSNTTLDHYGRGASHLRRILETLGIERKAKNVSPGSSALLELYRLEGKIKPEDYDE